MYRRDFLQLAVALGLYPTSGWRPRPRSSKRLFFDDSELPRIRSNATSSFLSKQFSAYLEADQDESKRLLDETRSTTDFITTLRLARLVLERESLVYLVTGDRKRGALAREALDVFLGLEQWDYFMDGKGNTLGFQRAPETLIGVLFATEVQAAMDPTFDPARVVQSVAEKGCAPCFRSLTGMKNAATTTDWQFDPDYSANYDVDMSKWPSILDKTNLKAIPIAGLGIGALAMSGFDDRSSEWLDLANESAFAYLSLFSEDGGYFEGISYADYSLRYLTMYFEASLRVDGSINWEDEIDFKGVAEFVVASQMGVRSDGVKRDLVNFSDSNWSFHAAPLLWIANRTKDGLAQYAARRFSERDLFTDWLWLDTTRAESDPPAILMNKRLDLDWIICRSGWDDDSNVVAFRSGMPSNHEHADRNSFIFKAYGERLLTDHYGASYDWREKGWLLRLTEAHNSLLIDGQGHQYHDGSEGTNASDAEARITRYVDRGNTVSWTSDATQAYQLVRPEIESVTRSVLFLKPDVLVILDRVGSSVDVSVSCRFHPDNSDGLATIQPENGGFSIQRPKANLIGKIAATGGVSVSTGKLDLPTDDMAHLGDGELEDRPVSGYIFAEVTAETGSSVDIVTVLGASRGKDPIELSVEPAGPTWVVKTDKQVVTIYPTGDLPEFEIAEIGR